MCFGATSSRRFYGVARLPTRCRMPSCPRFLYFGILASAIRFHPYLSRRKLLADVRIALSSQSLDNSSAAIMVARFTRGAPPAIAFQP
eukprot:7468252-Pyramimonas_sp.AAC.1